MQWYDSTGVRHRKNLPKKEADQLYKQVIAEQVFESTGTVGALSAKAQNYKSLSFVILQMNISISTFYCTPKQ